MVRVYYNRSDDPDGKVWSVDNGPGTPEVTTKVALMLTHPGYTEQDRQTDAQNQPRAWIEFLGCDYEVMGNAVVIQKRKDF